MHKLRAPEGVSSFTLAGRSLIIEPDRSVMVPRDMVGHALSHGFDHFDCPTVALPALLVAVEDMNRLQLEDAILAAARADMANLSDEQLRHGIIGMRKRQQPDELNALMSAEDASTDAPLPADPAAMSYNDQKAWLKARGVAVPHPVTADVVQAIVAAELVKV